MMKELKGNMNNAGRLHNKVALVTGSVMVADAGYTTV
jgi:hypothetical protein